MKILIIRHADPDFYRCSITKQGEKEVNALANYLKDAKFKAVYSSPLNRAKITATSVVKNQKITYLDYLKEFVVPFEYKGDVSINWDFLPSDIEKDFKDFYQIDKYLDIKYFKAVNMKQLYLNVVTSFDATLAKHGYVRKGPNFYEVKKSNNDTIVFFCHFGTMCVLLSRILNIPYTVIAQSFCCLPTGITTLVSEERRKGIAHFRVLSYGDISHLELMKVKPSFAARFCEQYKDKTRHD